jgi:CRP-like cAMP-binding protein
MLLTIEKVAYLKGVEIFADTPDHLLAAVARITEEVELYPDETIIHEGEVGDSLYIVVEGAVRVHSQGKTLLTLGPGAVVGELAVLDPEPRSATVTTEEDSLLFCIKKEPFDEVMADRPGIAQGVIRVLCKRIREEGRLLTEGQQAGSMAINQVKESEE